MNLTFEEAVPISDNPWAEGVERIAGKIDEKTGKPKGLMTTIPLPDPKNEEAVAAYNKLLRDAHKAGREQTPPVTVRKTVSAPKTRTVGRGSNQRDELYVEVTIWTVPLQVRPRKPTAGKPAGKPGDVPATGPGDVPATDPADVPTAEFSNA